MNLVGSFDDVPMDEENITCTTESLRMNREKLEDVLYEQGITLDAAGQKLLGLVADVEMVCQALCRSKNDFKEGPFLMVVKLSSAQKDSFKTLLNELTGDDKLTELFDLLGPASVRVLRCRPVFWKTLQEACVKSLG